MVAVSKDGSTFSKNQIVYTLTSSYNANKYRGYSTPAVYINNGIFYLYHDIVYNLNGFDQIAISSAKSSDGFNFKELEINIFTINNNDWKNSSVFAPTVLQDNGILKIWFAGQRNKPKFNFGIGYATKRINKK